MAKTSEEFVARLMDKLTLKMDDIRDDCKVKNSTKVFASVCECETILGILKEFVELDISESVNKPAFRDMEESNVDDDSDEDYRPVSTKKGSY